MIKEYSLAFLQKHLACQFTGDLHKNILSVKPLESAKECDLAFSKEEHLSQKILESDAGILLLSKVFFDKAKELEERAVLWVDNVEMALIRVLDLMYPRYQLPLYDDSIKSSSHIATTAVIGNNVSIGPFCIIEDNVIIGDNVTIHGQVFIGKGAVIGANSKLFAQTSIGHGCIIGEDCVLSHSVIIGAEGFGYTNVKGRWHWIPQVANVVIGDRVEIGALTSIDRGALEDTKIGNDVIIDNHCHLGHNVQLGDGCAMAGGAKIAGSTTVGRYCQIGGAAIINGHIEICDHAKITGNSMILKSIEKPGVYSSGIVATDNMTWRKMNVRVQQLDSLFKKVKKLEEEIESLKTQGC